MKKSTIDRQRPIIAHCQSPVVAEPGEGALDDPAPPVAPQRSAILRRRFAPTFAVWNDRFDPAATQLFTQPIAIVATVHDHALGFLSRSSRAMPDVYADRGEGRLRELDFRRGCRVKVVSQRNTSRRRPPPSTSSPCPASFFRLRRPLFGWSETAVQERFTPFSVAVVRSTR